MMLQLYCACFQKGTLFVEKASKALLPDFTDTKQPNQSLKPNSPSLFSPFMKGFLSLITLQGFYHRLCNQIII